MTLRRRRSQALLAGILTGITAGLLAGWLLGAGAAAFAPLGTFFLDALQMLVIPLVVTSMVVGVASLGDVRLIGRTSLTTLACFAATTAIAVAIGLVLVNAVAPGQGIGALGAGIPEGLDGSGTDPWQVLLSFVHPSLFGAMVEMQLLPIVVLSLAFGAALTTLGEGGRRVLDLAETANDAILKIVDALLWLAPLGVFGLVAGQIGKVGGFEAFLPVLGRLGAYVATVLAALALHGGIVLPLVVRLVARRPALPFLDASAPALATAFATASSAATVPVTLDCVMGPCEVRPRIARFVVPLGATINRSGTALFEAVAALFIAQAYGIELSLGQQAIVFVMATLAAIGAAGIPQAGLVTMVMVLTAVDLPVEGVGLVLAVDWLLDRFRTAVNVWGDMVGAAVVERFEPPAPLEHSE